MSAKITTGLLCVFLFSLAFMQPAIDLSGAKVQISDLIFVVLVISLSVSVATGQIKPRRTPYVWLFLGFSIVMLLSAAFSANIPKSVIRLGGKVYLAAIPYVVMTTLDSHVKFRIATGSWIAGAAVCVGVGLMSLLLFYVDRGNPLLGYTLFHLGTLPPGDYPRLASTFVNANMLANYLNVSLLIVVAGIAGVIGRGLRTGLIAGVLIVATFTISPGLGGFFLAAGMVLWFFNDARPAFPTWIRKVLVGAGIIGAAAFVFAASVSPARQPEPVFAFDVGDVHLEPSSRFLTWRAAIGTFTDHPLLGVGVGLETCRVGYSDLSGRDQLLTEAHNAFINVAADSGVLGFAATFGIVFFFGRRITSPDFAARILAIALICGFLYHGLTGSFEDSRHLWALMGLIGFRNADIGSRNSDVGLRNWVRNLWN